MPSLGLGALNSTLKSRGQITMTVHVRGADLLMVQVAYTPRSPEAALLSPFHTQKREHFKVKLPKVTM